MTGVSHIRCQRVKTVVFRMWCHVLWWECCNFVEVANSAQMVCNMKLLDVKFADANRFL